jgi:hypothetical protein
VCACYREPLHKFTDFLEFSVAVVVVFFNIHFLSIFTFFLIHPFTLLSSLSLTTVLFPRTTTITTTTLLLTRQAPCVWSCTLTLEQTVKNYASALNKLDFVPLEFDLLNHSPA